MAKMQIRRMGVFSVAKMYAVICATIGLIIGVIYGVIIIIFGAAILAGGGSNTGAAGAGSIIGGIIAMIAIPVFYGVFGFIFGAIGALVYNIASGFVGGVELELENVGGDYASPPQPQQQWGAGSYQQGGQQ